MREFLRVVTIGGGSGQSTLLGALRQLPYVQLDAIVTPFDSGGSSRKLKDQYDVLPYGDIQRCVFALSPFEHVRDIFSSRLHLEALSPPYHTGGNLLLSALEQDFRQHMDITEARRLAIRALEQMFHAGGRVHPAALLYTDLCATFHDGTQAEDEADVDRLIQRGFRLRGDVHLARAVPANASAVEAVTRADLIVISPGSWYTSVIPPMLPQGMPAGIAEDSRAPILWVTNLLTEGDDMAEWDGDAFIRELIRFTGRPPAAVLVNDTVLHLGSSYESERKRPLKSGCFDGRRHRAHTYPLCTDAGVPRHDTQRLARALGMLIPNVVT